MKRIFKRIWEDIRRGDNVDLYITVTIAILASALSVFGIPQASALIAPLTLAVLALLAVSLLVNRRLLEKYARDTEAEKAGFRRLYPNISDSSFMLEFQNLIQNARRIKIYSIGANIFWDPNLFEILAKRVESRQVKEAIFLLADPKDPHIEERIEEEKKDLTSAPRGPEQLEWLQNKLRDLASKNPDIVRVGQFHHYPAFALMIVDEDIFCYAYGYQRVGTAAPVLHLRNNKSAQTLYFKQQFDRLIDNYLPRTI